MKTKDEDVRKIVENLEPMRELRTETDIEIDVL